MIGVTFLVIVTSHKTSRFPISLCPPLVPIQVEFGGRANQLSQFEQLLVSGRRGDRAPQGGNREGKVQKGGRTSEGKKEPGDDEKVTRSMGLDLI